MNGRGPDDLAALYRRATAGEAPAAATDARILRQAAREPLRRRLVAGLALAACLLLALAGLVWHRSNAAPGRPPAALATAPETLDAALPAALLRIDAAPPPSPQEAALLRIPAQPAR